MIQVKLRSDWADDAPYKNYLVDPGIVTLINLDDRVIHFAPTKVGHVVHPDDWDSFLQAVKNAPRTQPHGWSGAIE